MQKNLFLAVSVLAAVTVVPMSGAGAEQPNVIMILCDDMGYGDLYNTYQHTRDNGAGGGIAGDGIRNGTEEPFIYTPGLDRMAAEGIRLTRHYTSAPVCAPARSSLLQGLDQGHATVRNNSFDKPIADNHTIGTVMREAGYYTACIGKWGIGGENPPYTAHPNDRGFDYFYGYMEHLDGHDHYPDNAGTQFNSGPVYEDKTPITSGLDLAYTTDLWTARVKDIIQNRNANQPSSPFFIYLAYDAPHAQLQVPTQAYPAGSGITGGLTWPLNTNSGVKDSYFHPDYISLAESPKRHATMIRRIDDGVADILQTLRDLGIDSNTLVVFTSDNGPHDEGGYGGLNVVQNPRFFKSYAFMEGIKRDQWEGGIRVPAFAWWPTKIGDNNPNTAAPESMRPSAFWDWMPTFADAAGVVPPAWSTGVSLLPELTKTGTQLDKGHLYFEYKNGGAANTPTYSDFPNHGGTTRGEMQTIFMDDTDGTRYKGVRYNISNHTKDFQIYNVDTDPSEGINLAASKPALQQKMKDKVLRVRVDGDYSRSYSSENVPAVLEPVVSGLEYKAFIGNWGWVPETDYLVPVVSGECDGLDLSVRTQDDNVAIEYTGFISVPNSGVYTFSMTTDATVSGNSSGGVLWLHDAHLIDDDFNHNGSPRSATIRLEAGLHPIRVLYKHATGTHDLSLSYSGPGISSQPVPNSVLFRSGVIPPGPPIANDDSVTTIGHVAAPGTSVLINVLANDLDDGTPDPLSITDLGTPLAGSAAMEAGQIRYTPNQGFFGTDHFVYTITDGQDFDSANVSVGVTVPLSANLWFPLNETSGSTAAEACGQNVGTLSGFADNEAAHIAGVHGNALAFDGVSAQVNLSGITLPTGNSPRTVSAWVRSSKTTAGDFQVIFGYGENINGERFSFRLDNSNPATQPLRLEVQGGFIVGTTKLNDGVWHHVAVVVDDFNSDGTVNVNETKLYVDGNLETIASSLPRAINTSTTGAPVIGGSSHAENYNFAGDIDEVRVFNKALSATEIMGLVNETTATIDGNLWYLQNLGNASPGSADWANDRDGDGYNHYAAYALGGSPHWFSQAMLPYFMSALEGFNYQYNRRSALNPTNYILETTSSLMSSSVWTPVSGGAAQSHPSLSGYDLVTVPIVTTGPSNAYFRLKIVY